MSWLDISRSNNPAKPKVLGPAPEKGRDCSECPLEVLGGKTFSRWEGKGTLRVGLIGEALGGHEQEDGLPFRPQAQAGSVLEKALRNIGVSREQVALWNVVGCRPPGNVLAGAPYELSAIDHCQIHFRKFIREFQPRCLVALGNIPHRYLTGMAGPKQSNTYTRGFVLDGTRYPIPVVSTYHPSYIARGNYNLLSVLMTDISRAIDVAKEGVTRPNQNYSIFPSRELAEDFYLDCLQHPELKIFCDIETVESLKGEDESDLEKLHEQITQIQFSIRPGQSIVFYWAEPFISIAKKILSLPNSKCGWNWWHFDYPILCAHDATPKGVQEDSMWGWKLLQPDLPRGLQFVTPFMVKGALPWKHLSNEKPGWYGGCDSDFNLQNDLGIRKALAHNGMMKIYEINTIEFNNTVLKGASARGVPMNREKLISLGEFLTTASNEILAQIQPLVPEHLKTLKIYKKNPKDLSGLTLHKVPLELSVSHTCPYCSGKGFVTVTVEAKRERYEVVKCGCGGSCEECEGAGVRRVKVKASKEKLVKCKVCKGKGITSNGDKEVQEVERWCRVLPFNPASSKQMIRYIEWRVKDEIEQGVAKTKRKWYVPKDIDTDKDTTGKDEIKRLYRKTGDEVLKLSSDYREYTKLKGTYVKGWMPKEDGAVHASFKFTPATGQLAATGPNVLTLPTRSDISKRFKAAVEAPEGRYLVAADHTAFHAQTLGWEADCPSYCRIARLDIHSFVTCHNLKVPEADKLFDMKDEELQELLKWYRNQERIWKAPNWTFEKLRNEQSKPSILGIGFGEGDMKLYEKNQESFESFKDVVSLKKLIKGLFPEVFKFQEEVTLRAYRTRHLTSLHRCVRYFFGLRWDPFKNCVMGEEKEAAMAFFPANDAHIHFRDELIRLERPGYNSKWGFFLPYHDAGYWMPLEKDLEECCSIAKLEMEKPSEVLVKPSMGAFQCGVEVKFGRNLAEMEKWKG